jgi:hypothetical protein
MYIFNNVTEFSWGFQGSRGTPFVKQIYTVYALLCSGREPDHSPPASAEVKKMWIYTSTPSYAFME